MDQYISVLYQLESLIPQLQVRAIPNESEAALEKLFESDQAKLHVFATENRKCAYQVQTLHESVTRAKESLEGLKASISRPDQVSAAVGKIIDIPETLEKLSTESIIYLKHYCETLADFSPILERELSDESTVLKFTNLIEILTSYSQVRVAAYAKAFDAEILESQRLLDDYILAQQKAALAGREKQVLDWYDLLSPNPDVKFTGLEPGRGEFVLKAEAFGRSMNAAASLSQSQLNCLGLSIYIPSVSAPGSPFRFILFDDPVQAMDDEHHESFLLRVVPELMDRHSFQIIILTHLKDTADRLRDNNYTRDYAYYRFDKLRPTGPVVVEHIVLADDMRKIRDLAKGNDDNRQMAVDRIRVLCESIMREAYLRHNGARMPVATGTVSAMIPFFAKVPNVTPAMVGELKDTVSWSNPAHHTQPGYTVPAISNINPHIERLQKIINALGLKK
jgi:hypothetical protein